MIQSANEAISYLRTQSPYMMKRAWAPKLLSIGGKVFHRMSSPSAKAVGLAVGKSMKGAPKITPRSKLAPAGVDKFTNTIYGKSQKSIADVAQRFMDESSHQARKSWYVEQGGGSWWDKLLGRGAPRKMTKQQVKAGIRASEQAIDGAGSYGARVGRNAWYDITHPIDNIKRTLFDLTHKYVPDPKGIGSLMGPQGQLMSSGKVINKTTGEIAKSVAGQAVWPLAFSLPYLADKEMSTGKKIGNTAAMFAIPMAFRKFIPSMVAFNVAGKFLDKKPPKPPQMPPQGQMQ